MIALQPVWDRINAQFWTGQLPPVRLAWADLSADALGCTFGASRRRQGTVLVARSVTALGGSGGAALLHDVLLHESIHVMVAEVREHGAGFAREATRVAGILGLPAPAAEELPGWPMCVRSYASLPERAWREV